LELRDRVVAAVAAAWGLQLGCAIVSGSAAVPIGRPKAAAIATIGSFSETIKGER
jgi:hypothetical protein